MGQFERAVVVSCRLSVQAVVTIARSVSDHSMVRVPNGDHLRLSNQQGWVTLGQNLGRKGLTGSL